MRQRLKQIYHYLCNAVDTPAIILLYHRVTKLPIDTHLLAVSPDHFHDHVSYLKKEYYLISPEEFVFLKKNKNKFPPKSVLLTFDDGYADNYLEATPILESLDAQAIFYITTSKLNSNGKLWWDELEELLLNNSTAFPTTLKLRIKGQTCVFSTATKEDRLNTHHQLHPLVKSNTIVERETILDEIREWSILTGSENRFHRLLNYQELIAMSKSKACILGSHTHDHAALSQLSFEDQLFQIKKGKDELENFSGQKNIHFSYPFGTKGDYNQASINICRNLGFEMVCSNYYSQVHSWSDPYQLPRMLVRDWDNNFFKDQLTMFFKW